MSRVLLVLLAIIAISCSKQTFYCVGPADSDIVGVLESEGFRVRMSDSVENLLETARDHSPVLLLSSTYPEFPLRLSGSQVETIKKKGLRVFAEFATLSDSIPELRVIDKERVVVVDSLGAGLPPMALLSLNRAAYLDETAEAPLAVIAKVAGLDRAEYGLDGTPTRPLLYRSADGILISTTCIGDFARLRYMPEKGWKALWEYILGELTGDGISIKEWPVTVRPSYEREERLGRNARRKAIERGAGWFIRSGFLVDSSWAPRYVYNRHRDDVLGHGLPEGLAVGDGSLGILEGHCSGVDNDGVQGCRYWMRADVQGESAMALSLAGKMFGNGSYLEIASKLMDYTFTTFRDGPRNDPSNPGFGLLNWGMGWNGVYFGDDNARCILGMCMAASVIGSSEWDDRIVECILGNFRTSDKWGFKPVTVFQNELEKNGLEYYRDGDFDVLRPHFESWLWACYLWLYRQSGYEPLLEKPRGGIYRMMEGYPSRWGWTNGIQQERARMILPLAWLYRVEPNERNLDLLMKMAGEFLNYQVGCGAIREELGAPGSGEWGKIKSNSAYGTGEAPLIFDNGDPIADLLYTTNFGLFGLVEAAKATGDDTLKEAVRKMADFVVRSQVESPGNTGLDGAWFRAFNFRDWNYWAQDSDWGWGSLCTLTGWIQSWILTSLALIEEDSSYWDVTATSGTGKDITRQIEGMLP